MADPLNLVKPGDLISAELINAIIQLLNALATSSGGPNVVPNLFSRTVLDVKALIAQSGGNLQLALSMDASGLVVNLNDPKNNARPVIGQIPTPGTRVPDGTGIHLLVATQAGSTPTPPAKPTISGFSPLTPNIGTEVQIIGENFDAVRGNNTVTFDGTVAAPPSNASTRYSLFVVVPSVANPPAAGQQKTVTVVVTNPAGATSSQLIILGPTGTPLPAITPFSIPNAPLGGELVINGQNFGTTLTNIRVFFDDQPRDGTSGTPIGVQPLGTSTLPSRLVVTIPTSLTGINLSGDSKVINIKVRVGTAMSPTQALEIYKP